MDNREIAHLNVVSMSPESSLLLSLILIFFGALAKIHN